MQKFSEYTPELLSEKLIMFNQGKKYGQIVFVMGGAGSGKGFAIDKFMDTSNFKVRDVDEFKKSMLKLNDVTQRHDELKGLDLSNPKDVSTLHQFVKDKGIREKSLTNLLADVDSRRLPNILFDVTGKDFGDIEKRLDSIKGFGYDPKDIHIVWVLANYHVAVKANKNRERIVPDDILLKTHKGAGKTFMEIVRKGLPRDINGAVHVILNNRENTVFAKNDDGTVNMDVIEDFVRLTLKKEGKKMRNDDAAMKQLRDWLVGNLPKESELQKDIDITFR